MCIMDKDLKEHYKAILKGQLDELLQCASETVSDMTHSKDEHFPDPTDRAALETDRNFQLRVKDRERKLAGKVEEALKRLESGEFGICEICGENISQKRLEVRPVTTYCIDCKTEEEESEKGH